MTPFKDTERNGILSSTKEEGRPTKSQKRQQLLIVYANVKLASCKELAIKHIAKQLKTRLHGLI